MIAATTIDHLYREYRDKPMTSIAYIYCNFQQQHEQRYTNLLPSLLKQFVQGQSFIPNAVRILYDEYKRRKSTNSRRNSKHSLQCRWFLLKNFRFESFDGDHLLRPVGLITRAWSNPLYSYAALTWGYHARKACMEENKLVLDFIDNAAKLSICGQFILHSQLGN